MLGCYWHTGGELSIGVYSVIIGYVLSLIIDEAGFVYDERGRTLILHQLHGLVGEALVLEAVPARRMLSWALQVEHRPNPVVFQLLENIMPSNQPRCGPRHGQNFVGDPETQIRLFTVYVHKQTTYLT